MWPKHLGLLLSGPGGTGHWVMVHRPVSIPVTWLAVLYRRVRGDGEVSALVIAGALRDLRVLSVFTDYVAI